jgi:N4-(beta-N-acetylglucosaminyl)-L-asparaginase
MDWKRHTRSKVFLDFSQPLKRYSNSKLIFLAAEEKLSHDTIGMLAIDRQGRIASGTSTNGATFKIPGRVGDSSITGAGSYVDQEVGGAAATGDGDILMRFLPSYATVENMRQGMDPSSAAGQTLLKISKHYPEFSGAIVALKIDGSYGAACYGFKNFTYAVANSELGESKVFSVTCDTKPSSGRRHLLNNFLLFLLVIISCFPL